jgi:transcriptional regulator with XRE-family HTH domain
MEDIARTLKEARENKGLSQRALSAKAGVPQSHISKIEKGAVDLRLSSLIELARVLDLELTLVPRKTVPAVNSIVRNSAPSTPHGGIPILRALKELHRIQDTLANVSKATQAVNEATQLQRRITDLSHFSLDNTALKAIRDANKTLQAVKDTTQAIEAIRNVNAKFEQIRNALAHSSSNIRAIESPRPAYSLDDEDDDA